MNLRKRLVFGFVLSIDPVKSDQGRSAVKQNLIGLTNSLFCTRITPIIFLLTNKSRFCFGKVEDPRFFLVKKSGLII